MEENCTVDVAATTLWLSKIFGWYARDFGDSAGAIAAFVLELLRGEKREALQSILKAYRFKVRHMPYDWSDNLKNAKVFK